MKKDKTKNNVFMVIKQASTYWFKVINSNSGKMCEVLSSQQLIQQNNTNDFFLVPLLLTMNLSHTFFLKFLLFTTNG